MQSGSSVHRLELVLVVVSFLMCGSYAWWVEEVRPSDLAEYHELATNLLHGRGYYQEPGYRAFRTPGLVLYLAAIYALFGIDNVAAVRSIQVALFAASGLLFYRLARRLLRPATAFFAAICFVFSHELVFWAAKPATEFLYTVLLLAACWCTVRFAEVPGVRWATLAGVSFGAAALTRPIAFAIAPLWLGAVLVSFWRSRRRTALLAAASGLLGFAAVTGPWIVRNTILLGRPVVATSAGITLWWANHPTADVGGWYGKVQPKPGQVVWLREGKTEVEINDLLMAQAIAYIRRDPVRFLRLGFGRLGYMLAAYRVHLTNVPYDSLTFAGLVGGRLIQWNLAFLLFSVVGLLSVLRSRDARWSGALAVLVGSLAVHFVFTAVPRMRVPLLPVLFLLAAHGGQTIWEWGQGCFARGPKAAGADCGSDVAGALEKRPNSSGMGP